MLAFLYDLFTVLIALPCALAIVWVLLIPFGSLRLLPVLSANFFVYGGAAIGTFASVVTADWSLLAAVVVSILIWRMVERRWLHRVY